MAANSKEPEEKKTAAGEPVEVKAEEKTKTTATRKSVKRTTAAPKKKSSTVKKAAAATKKTTAASTKKPKTADTKEKIVDEKKEEAPTVEVEKVEPPQEETIQEESIDVLKPEGINQGALILGGGLMFMGLLLLITHLMDISFGTFIWPFIFLVPGALVFLAALTGERRNNEGLAVFGGILFSLGFVFLAQSVTRQWASWAYDWALIAPTSIGFSQMIYGMHKDREDIVKIGRRLVKIGLSIFAVGFVFFELILGISGFWFSRLDLPKFPMMLIFAGVIVLIHSFIKRRSS